MSQSKGVITCDFFNGRLHQSRENGHDQTQQQCAGYDLLNAVQTCNRGQNCNQAGHVQGMMSGQEDELELREPRQNNVEAHTQCKNRSGLYGIIGQSQRGNRLIVRNDALDMECDLEQIAKRDDCLLNNICACAQDDEAQDGLYRALDARLHILFLEQQTEQCNQTYENSRCR